MKFSSNNFVFPKWFEMSLPDSEHISDKLSLCFVVSCDDLDSPLLGSEIDTMAALGTGQTILFLSAFSYEIVFLSLWIEGHLCTWTLWFGGDVKEILTQINIQLGKELQKESYDLVSIRRSVEWIKEKCIKMTCLEFCSTTKWLMSFIGNFRASR